jgi:MSHA biogenesis protein MshM
LKQRITFSYKLRPLNTSEVEHYIQHRLQVAGHNSAPLFSRALAKKVAKVSGGIPRLVNIICHKMLMLAYGEGRYQLTNKHLSRAIEDTEGMQDNTVGKYYLISLLIVSVLAGLYFSWDILGTLL